MNPTVCRRHWEIVRRLVHARRASPALRGEHIEFFADDFAVTNLVRYRRWDDAGNVALVALNFGSEPRETLLPLPCSALWREIVTGRVEHLGDGPHAFLLPPWQGRLFLLESALPR